MSRFALARLKVRVAAIKGSYVATRCAWDAARYDRRHPRIMGTLSLRYG